MKRVLRILQFCLKRVVLFFCLFSNLSVRAVDSHVTPLEMNLGKIQKGIVQEPKDCLLKPQMVCGLKTGSRVRTLIFEGAEYYLGENTVVIRKEKSRWYLQKGYIWVRSEMPLTIETRYSEILPGEAGLSALVEVDSSSGESIVPLEVPSVMSPKGSEDFYQLPVGVQAKVKGFNSKGEGFLRIPTSSHPKTVIEKWSRLYPGMPAELAKTVAAYREKWTEYASGLANEHKKIYQRRVANHEEKMRRRAESRRRYKAESRRLREIFKSKNYH